MRGTYKILLAALLLLTVGCAKDKYGGNFGNFAELNITVDSTVPDDQYYLLQQDIQVLSTLQFSELNDRDYRKMMGIEEITPERIKGWLGARLHILVGETFEGAEQSNPNSDVVTNALNLGAAKFLDNGIVVVTLTDGSTKQYNSPRTAGLVKIGPGLFRQRVTSSQLNSRFHSYIRLATLFHEGRHDDARGAFTAMPHATCPQLASISQSYWGTSSCENFANGPYIVSDVVLTHLWQECSRTCTATEKARFQSIQADYKTRRLGTAQFVDDTPEGS